jgi:hypothetical protein
MEEPQSKRGPHFRNAGRLQELWNALVPTKDIARELGFYDSRNVCRSVRAMRKAGYDFIYRASGRPNKDGTQRAWRKEPKAPTEKQRAYWAALGPLKKEFWALRRDKEKELKAKQAFDALVIPLRPTIENGVFRCSYCSGRTDDPMGHPSCRDAVA